MRQALVVRTKLSLNRLHHVGFCRIPSKGNGKNSKNDFSFTFAGHFESADITRGWAPVWKILDLSLISLAMAHAY